jgi:hypothetical protein
MGLNEGLTDAWITEIMQWTGETRQRIDKVLNNGRINSEAGGRLRMAKAHLEIVMELASLARYGVQPE